MILQELAEEIGISGGEDAVRNRIISAIRDHVDDMRIDNMGNLIAYKQGAGVHQMKVLIAAHMDEVGFMVVGHDSSGLIEVDTVGGIDAKLLPAMRVKVGEDKLDGVFVWKPIHLSSKREITSIGSMRVDIGATSKDSAASSAPIGTLIGFASEYRQLGERTVRCKAFDDRVGCSELIDILQGEPLPYDLYAAFTVQEEIGLRGAKVVSHDIEPDFAIVLEATACHEVPQDPDEPDVTTVTKLGQGPVISYKDRSSIVHPSLLKHFTQTASKHDVPYQYRSAQFAGGNDAGSIHLSGVGIPSLAVSLPCRYLHSPYSIISLDDYDNAIKLVTLALEDMTPENLER